jgi:hypothetical protein
MAVTAWLGAKRWSSLVSPGGPALVLLYGHYYVYAGDVF